MRKLMIVWLAALALLAACSAGGATDVDMATEGAEDGDVTAITLITPEPDENDYPAPDNPYPVSPVEALLPTGYPEMTVEVPPTDLTPGSAGDVVETRPPSSRPLATPFPVPERVLAALVRHLSALSDVPADEIAVVSAEPMVWPNGGLGCPAEGMAYTEVQVEGMRIVLEAGEQPYDYHTDGAQRYVLCQDGRPIASGAINTR